MEFLSANSEAFSYLMQEQSEGVPGLRAVLCGKSLSDQETLKSRPHSLGKLLRLSELRISKIRDNGRMHFKD